jgi:hypothetical protein
MDIDQSDLRTHALDLRNSQVLLESYGLKGRGPPVHQTITFALHQLRLCFFESERAFESAL